jgi:G:T/U-mismatch repair DNA glycosylase
MQKIEQHPLEPFLPGNTKLLMLGSFPPKRERWKMDFYYPNFQNDMWRIFGLCFFDDKEHFLTNDKKSFNPDVIKDFLLEKGIGIGDTARSVIRHKDNASDNFLEVVESSDIVGILNEIPLCQALVTTGQKATDTLLNIFDIKEPKIGNFSEFQFQNKTMRLYRMPSSSRAYPKSLVDKAEIYKTMFQQLHLL